MFQVYLRFFKSILRINQRERSSSNYTNKSNQITQESSIESSASDESQHSFAVSKSNSTNLEHVYYKNLDEKGNIRQSDYKNTNFDDGNEVLDITEIKPFREETATSSTPARDDIKEDFSIINIISQNPVHYENTNHCIEFTDDNGYSRQHVYANCVLTANTASNENVKNKGRTTILLNSFNSSNISDLLRASCH